MLHDAPDHRDFYTRTEHGVDGAPDTVILEGVRRDGEFFFRAVGIDCEEHVLLANGIAGAIETLVGSLAAEWRRGNNSDGHCARLHRILRSSSDFSFMGAGAVADG